MSCGCVKPEKAVGWTPIPEYRQPTEMLPGENMDCYAKRAGNPSGMMDDVAEKPADKINNTSITSDLTLNVDVQFELTPNPTRTAVTWRIWVDGTPGVPAGMGLSFNTSTGKLSGTVADSFANKQYKVLISAYDSTTELIDSKEYNFFPKKGEKSDTVKFVFPYTPNGKITSPFGERIHPVTGKKKLHAGIDISQPGSALGEILSTADGTVVKAGPAGGYGNWIQIEHRSADGKLVATSLYGHMKDIYVKVGQKVAAGQKIAKEGSEGVGTAAHLHFEIHKGGYKNPVDPVPYLSGTVTEVNAPTANQGGTDERTTTKTNTGMTSPEASAPSDCPNVLPNQTPAELPPHQPTPPEQPTPDQPLPVVGDPGMEAALTEEFDESDPEQKADADLLRFMAKIESRNDPTAKNKTSSATGLFQMLDKTASVYYKKLTPPLVADETNRKNAYLSTKAQIKFYTLEQKKYWDDYIASGRTKINNRTLDPAVQTRYASLNKGEFIYGLIHHDGVGNAVNGIDRQGVDYYRKKKNEA